jgi:hypothetical protein
LLADNQSTDTASYQLQLIVLDSQWWLHPYRKPKAATRDEQERHKEKIVAQLDQMLEDSDRIPTVVVGHHPLYSRGRHGAHFSWQTHLIPPIFGSLYVLYRKIWGLPQDIPHRRYQHYKQALLSVFEQYDDLIYASGHDHNLQYLPISHGGDSLHHYIVSGAGSRHQYARKGGDAEFVYSRHGFASIDFYRSGTRKLAFWDQKGQKIYEGWLN